MRAKKRTQSQTRSQTQPPSNKSSKSKSIPSSSSKSNKKSIKRIKNSKKSKFKKPDLKFSKKVGVDLQSIIAKPSKKISDSDSIISFLEKPKKSSSSKNLFPIPLKPHLKNTVSPFFNKASLSAHKIPKRKLLAKKKK